MSTAFLAWPVEVVLLQKLLEGAKIPAHSRLNGDRGTTSGVLTPTHSKSIVKLRWLKPRGGTRAVMRHESS